MRVSQETESKEVIELSKRGSPRKKAAPKKKLAESVVKIFLAEGSYREKKTRVIFKKEVRALQPEHVKERIYRELGSRHRLKMREISFSAITEIDPSDPKVEIQDPSVKFLASEEVKKLALPVR